jgi:hypothetical protein
MDATGGWVSVGGKPGAVIAPPEDGARLMAGPDGVGTSGTEAGGIGGGRSVKNCADALRGASTPIKQNSAKVHVKTHIRRAAGRGAALPVWGIAMWWFFTENAANSSLTGRGQAHWNGPGMWPAAAGPASS